MTTARLSTEAYVALDNQIESILDQHADLLGFADTQIVTVELKVDEQWGFWAWARNLDEAPEPNEATLLGIYGDEGAELIMGKLQVRYGKPGETYWKFLLEEEQEFLLEAVVPLEMREDATLADRVITYHYLGTSEPPAELTLECGPKQAMLMEQYLQGVRMGLLFVPMTYLEEEFSVPRLPSAIEVWTYDLGSLLSYVIHAGDDRVEDAAAHFVMAVQVASMSKDSHIQQVAYHLKSVMTVEK